MLVGTKGTFGCKRVEGRRRFARAGLLGLAALLVVVGINGAEDGPAIPNGTRFPNPGGTSMTYSATGPIDLGGPFFQSLGTNGRACGTCHQPSDGMSVSAAHVQDRFEATLGLDPLFRTVDGSDCNHNIDVSTVAGRRAAYSLLRTRGLIRIAIAVPATADFEVVSVSNPYGCNETDTISMYRRPLPATNLRFLSAVMFDGRESTPLTGTTKIVYANYPTSLENDLKHQALDATTGHAQGSGLSDALQQQIVDFEMGLFTAQATGKGVGALDEDGAYGGSFPLVNQPFFISMNSSIDPLFPPGTGPEAPGGLVTPGDGIFTPSIFHLFGGWAQSEGGDRRAAVARGEVLFNSKPITITGVAGINDAPSAGGLGVASVTGTCGTCHDSPNVGNHSFPTPLNIGTGDPDPANPSVNRGGLDISYLPKITVCRKGTTPPNAECVTTTDLGQALIDGKFDHTGKIKGPILRGLSARAPFFHNGAAQTLLDAVRFYEGRFGVQFTAQDESDLVAFLSVL
jgi:cytochrome c peroxidase